MQEGALTLLRRNGALRLGCAHRGWPLALLLRRRVLLKHQLELELALLPARARRGPHRPPAARTGYRWSDRVLSPCVGYGDFEVSKKFRKFPRDIPKTFIPLLRACHCSNIPPILEALDVTSATFRRCFHTMWTDSCSDVCSFFSFKALRYKIRSGCLFRNIA